MRSDREGRDAVLAPQSLSHTARCLGERLPSRGAGPAAGGTRRAAPFAPRLATARRSGHSRRPNGRRSAGADGELACRAAGGQQRQLSSQERVRSGSEGRPRSPPPHSDPLPLRRRGGNACPGASATPPPHTPTPAAGRGEGGSWPPIRSCSPSLIDKRHHPIGAVTSVGGATEKGGSAVTARWEEPGAGQRPGAWLGGQGRGSWAVRGRGLGGGI